MPSKPSDPDPDAVRADPADAFEVWLRCELHLLYSSITAEPIPPDLLQLVDGLPEDSRATTGPSPPPAGETGPCSLPRGLEQRVRERAYFLWLEEGRPEGQAAEHWRLATILQTAQEADEASTPRNGSTGAGRRKVTTGSD